MGKPLGEWVEAGKRGGLREARQALDEIGEALAALRLTAREALVGGSNDAEHDALVDIAYALGVDWQED